MFNKAWLARCCQVSYCTLACLSLVLGLIGIITPLLPTTPFLLLSAWAAARSSQRLHHWLLTHPYLSQFICHWHQQRAIASSAKRLAMLMLASSWLVLAFLGMPWLVLCVSLVTFVLIGSFICTRASPNSEQFNIPDNINLYQGCANYDDIRAYRDAEVFYE